MEATQLIYNELAFTVDHHNTLEVPATPLLEAYTQRLRISKLHLPLLLPERSPLHSLDFEQPSSSPKGKFMASAFKASLGHPSYLRPLCTGAYVFTSKNAT